jgi:hypothetical protein
MTLRRQTAILIVPLLLALALVSAAGRYAMEQYESDWGMREEFRGAVVSIAAHLGYRLQQRLPKQALRTPEAAALETQRLFEQSPQVIEGLAAHPSLLAVCLYSADGALSTATFLRSDACPKRLSSTILQDRIQNGLAVELVHTKDITHGIALTALDDTHGKELGLLASVHDASGMTAFHQELILACAGYLAAALLVALGVVFLTSSTLQRALTELTSRTLHMLDASLRQQTALTSTIPETVPSTESRILELAELRSAFSTMRAIFEQVLAQVRQRYIALERYRGVRGLQEAFSRFCNTQLQLTKNWQLGLLRSDQPGWFFGSSPDGAHVFMGKVAAQDETEAVRQAAAAQLLLRDRVGHTQGEDAIAALHSVVKLARLTLVSKQTDSVAIFRFTLSAPGASTFSISKQLQSLTKPLVVSEVPGAPLSQLEACTRVCADAPIETLAATARKLCGNAEGMFLAIKA